MGTNVSKIKTRRENQTIAKRLSIEVDEVSIHEEIRIIGGATTILCFKNPTTYLISTEFKGLKLIENSREIYSALLPCRSSVKPNIIYDENQDCFFF